MEGEGARERGERERKRERQVVTSPGREKVRETESGEREKERATRGDEPFALHAAIHWAVSSNTRL